MNILSIETSCDETAVALLACKGDPRDHTFSFDIIGNALHSQIASHEQFGGVVPMLAKREHAKNLIPLFLKAIKQLDTKEEGRAEHVDLAHIFGRETDFLNEFIEKIATLPRPNIDAIAVTEGPGLEPALWMGIIFAKALSATFDIPLIPVNHMEGHILSVLPRPIVFPALALLISGGHTELVLMNEWNAYKVIGQTRDDAVGEAFDKVARMLDLPYPGGPQISKLADIARTTQTSTPEYILPRPMIHSKDFDFSFSGIKTAVLYGIKEQREAGTETAKEVVAREFEDAVTEVLISKTFRAIDEHNIKTLIIGGGVISNTHIQQEFTKMAASYPGLTLLLPDPDLRTDNALMIGIAGYVKYLISPQSSVDETPDLKARGNLRVGSK